MNHLNEFLDQATNENQRHFKNKNRRYAKITDRKGTKSVCKDDFGDNYFYSDAGDKTEVVSITLPKSLTEELDFQRGGIPRSRYVRKCLEYILDIRREN